MKRKTRNSIWLLFLVVILAGLGFYLFLQMRQKQKESLPVETMAPAEDHQVTDEKEKVAPSDTTAEKEDLLESFPEEDPCKQEEKKVAEFFRYLDNRKYIRQIDPGTGTEAHFREILKKLTATPPVPAGEGTDPKIIARNISHFFRVLNSKDIRLIREIISWEEDTLEFDLQMFFNWLMPEDRCPDSEGLRPSLEVLYKYAGFFINTTGGRAYLSRRAATLRLLVTYYCILVIHEADKTGKNIYGIDIFPYIAPLRSEITHYPDFRFYQDYIDRLVLIESFYRQKRSQG